MTALAFAGMSVRVHTRSLVVCGVLLAGLLLAAVISIGTGDFPLSPGDVVAVLVGQGDPASEFIVETLRLPRVAVAVLVGAAFGIAGAIFQSISRNPLGSPDMIGFTMGSVTGAVLVILVIDGTTSQVALGAIVGGLVTAVIIYLLALRGGVQGYRLVLVGIGIAAVLQAVNAYLVARATREDAYEAAHWMIGSVNGRGWEHVWPVTAALAVLVPAALILARPLALLEMGDDAARVARRRGRALAAGAGVRGGRADSRGDGVVRADRLRGARRAADRAAADARGQPGPHLGGADGVPAAGGERPRGAAPAQRRPAGRRHDRRARRRLPLLAALDRMAADMTRLRGDDLELAYDQRVVAERLGIEIPDGSFTIIVGPNACGKTTLLRALARLLKPRRGGVYLDGELITSRSSKEVARELGLLPQSAIAPDGITAADLVARGRYPHQRLLRQWSADDARAVEAAMAATRVDDLADRIVDELSGGQRQRVWLAMALAQETPILLLDEPTTFLDIAHQVEVLDLCAELHAERGRTLVAVLHDLNHACRYATHLVAMREGAIVAQGEPTETVTAELVEEVFGLPCRVIDDPESGTPLVVPVARRVREPR